MSRALEATDDGVWEWNVQTNDVWFSSKFLKLIDAQDQDKPSLDLWMNHIHPDDREQINSALRLHFSSQIKYDISYRGLTGTGEHQWFRARGNSIFDRNGKPVLMSGILSNINLNRH